MADSADRAWAAGFFDGEGSFTFTTRSRGTSELVVQIGQVEREPLDRIQRILGGTINGPHRQKQPNAKPQYRWRAGGPRAVAIYEMLRPWLTEIKRVQAEAAIAKYGEYNLIPRKIRKDKGTGRDR